MLLRYCQGFFFLFFFLLGPAQGHLSFRNSAPQNHILFTPLLVSAKFLSYSCLQLPFKSEELPPVCVLPSMGPDPMPTGCDEMVGLKFAEILSGPTPLLPLLLSTSSAFPCPKGKGLTSCTFDETIITEGYNGNSI